MFQFLLRSHRVMCSQLYDIHLKCYSTSHSMIMKIGAKSAVDNGLNRELEDIQ